MPAPCSPVFTATLKCDAVWLRLAIFSRPAEPLPSPWGLGAALEPWPSLKGKLRGALKHQGETLPSFGFDMI